MSYVLRGTLKGHYDYVTTIATNSKTPDVLISGSRDKSIISWNLNVEGGNGDEIGVRKQLLRGHAFVIKEVVLSSDGAFALSCSNDRTLRLWDLNTGAITKTFTGHEKAILSVAFSADNKQIVSGSRDRSLKLWNTLGECKATKADAHTERVSCVRFSLNQLIVSAGSDNAVKVWDQRFELKYRLNGHSGNVNTVAVSPDGSMCASGGEDKKVMIWNLIDGSHMYSLEAGGVVHPLEFNPSKYWLCAVTDNCIRIWDLESKQPVCDITDFIANGRKSREPPCLCIAWGADGRTLYAGYSDDLIRVWEIIE